MLADANELIQAVKKASLDVLESTKPVNVDFGEVISVSPLQIRVEQKMTLTEKQLVLTRNVTDFVTMVTVNWESEEEQTSHFHNIKDQSDSGDDVLNGRTETQSEKHTHVITGQKQITIHNALEVGDTVILIRKQEGQQFIVVDRIGGAL